MVANDNGIANIVEVEIAKGEQDVVFEKYSCSERKKTRKTRDKSRSKVPEKTAKYDVPRTSTKFVSARIIELAQPTKQRALNTLKEKATILPSALVDNLIRIIEAESCLTPEKAAWVRRRKERRTKKATRLLSSLAKKRKEEIPKHITMRASTLDPDATMCQYLLAEHFVKSILEYRCEMRKETHMIADVIMKRLMSFDAYTNVRNDRAVQQLRFLADMVACWMIEINAEVGKTYNQALKEYSEDGRMTMFKINNDNEMNNKTKDRRQIKENNQEEKTNEIVKRNNLSKEKNEEEQKEESKQNAIKEKVREQLDDEKRKIENVKYETVEKERENEEDRKKTTEEEGERSKTEEKKEDDDGKEMTMKE